MATRIQKTVRSFFKKAVPAHWYNHDEQNRFHREMGELRKEFYRQGR